MDYFKKEFNIICFIYLVYSHVVTSFCLVGHIYVVVAPKGNEWGTDYWLARFLEGKQTLNVSVTNSKGIHFSIGSMVIKAEYLTLDERTRKKKGYVFEDYRPCHFVYHYTNLIIGTHIQLQTMQSKNSSKVRYFLPYSEHEKLMETISIRSDPDGLLE